VTARQRAAIEALRAADVPLSPLALGVAIGTSSEGAARTASSLIRHGFVVRTRRNGGVAYGLASKTAVAS